MTEANETRQRNERGRFVPGNKAAVKHGCHSLASRGKIPKVKGQETLKRELSEFRRQLETSLPSPLPTKATLLIPVAVSLKGFMGLYELACRRAGVLDPTLLEEGKIEYQPAFKYYLAAGNNLVRVLRELGLDKEQTEDIKTPYELISQEKGGKDEGDKIG
jgi:hypothetical protein